MKLEQARQIVAQIRPGFSDSTPAIDRETNAEIAARYIPLEQAEADQEVYMIYCAGLVKIGRSKSISARKAHLANSGPLPCRLVFREVGGSWVEWSLHERFKASRQHGEWFALSPELRDFLERHDDVFEHEMSIGEAEAEFREWLLKTAAAYGDPPVPRAVD